MFHIALHTPVMPANTGNIIRLTANNGCLLHLIEPLGFDFEEKKLRRAGLDYHDLSKVMRYPNFAAFQEAMGERPMFACTTKGSHCYTESRYPDESVLLFGSETQGLPDDVMAQFSASQRIRIPMMPNNRSLNLANAVAIISYEAWRQHDFAGGS
ncbi:tRNA (cytidine(34)-2'-O)-methyltransferase [Pseudidiomarina piscicola]|uniref:tRNA (cytidine(34)-2'-O)-methyltransferase n=1 Tax=Pseudidiomarina piscicola TaxID=2614830 RepID=A0A6S6WP54_9GAMM|nr:tRNA (cytidine(34)-2'-O)-methyltransferase [Pseudidiomarina piscicola]CAB0151397.1 tRNA (cytidine(34)-2'-O)-methyltransferase [Pseudidiomarina piscicola]VZT40877.1 tRNA (cytidine(34)-2'-O)-methyltransferase [Pseudomonas aeruginosa]